jgi:hypothetical protein
MAATLLGGSRTRETVAVAVEARAPTVQDVRRIVALGNPALRNLEITICYSRLAAAVAERNGAGANWCTFATWASRQAGRTIRGEDALDRIERGLGERGWLVHPIRSLWRLVLRRGLLRPESRLGRLTAELHTPFDAVERAAAAVARGNLKVFEEIGLEFARYLEECPPGDAAALQRFLERLRAGDPPDGQRYLRQAFERYWRLPELHDARERDRLAVLANLEIGLHEQTRLQPEIRAALDAGFTTHEELGLRALVALFPSARRWWGIVRRPAGALAGAAAGGLQRTSSRVAREVVTDSLMVLSLPGRVLALGTHLEDEYPESLRALSGAELEELVERYEPAPPAADDCGARDWSDLDQRMHYIVHLFCSFHERDELAHAPFTREQVSSIARGVVPDGEL